MLWNCEFAFLLEKFFSLFGSYICSISLMEVPCFQVDNTHHFEYCFLKIYPDIKLPPQVDHTKQKHAFGEVGT